MRRIGIVSFVCLWACGAEPTPGGKVPDLTRDVTSAAAMCIAEADPGVELPDGHPPRISVNHILVKHAAAKRVPQSVARTREEACMRALEALDKLKSGSEFDQLVAEYSDEEGAATRGGSIGSIKPDDVLPAFAAAAFALELNQVSNVVETPSGFHIILRTE